MEAMTWNNCSGEGKTSVRLDLEFGSRQDGRNMSMLNSVPSTFGRSDFPSFFSSNLPQEIQWILFITLEWRLHVFSHRRRLSGRLSGDWRQQKENFLVETNLEKKKDVNSSYHCNFLRVRKIKIELMVIRWKGKKTQQPCLPTNMTDQF